jgi:RHS repeat-associated protein
VWDYANRLIALGVGGATTTYGYDAFGQRVFQVGTTTTTLYPFKWYSVASSTGTGAKYATTTEYASNGDSLVSTTDQQTASGSATGTAQTRYIHPDHLGSTNVVTNASGTVVQTLDYYPYGGTRINTSVGDADSARKYIGQFADQSNLDYLNARYYDSGRGQFLTEDPVFLGNPNDQELTNPQSLNSYSYSKNNPITGKDPTGKFTALASLTLAAIVVALLYASLVLSSMQLVKQHPHPLHPWRTRRAPPLRSKRLPRTQRPRLWTAHRPLPNKPPYKSHRPSHLQQD